MFIEKGADQSGVLGRLLLFFFFFLPHKEKNTMCFSKRLLLMCPQNSLLLWKDYCSNQANLVKPITGHFLKKVTGTNFLRGIIFIQSLDKYSEE